jgi:RNA polymerase sigma-70 factor (ECF subfamily)
MNVVPEPPAASDIERLLVAMRPRLHRYCARMTGSVIDGEDVLQDALIKAVEARASAGAIGNPEGWLFRIAHNTALDFLRLCVCVCVLACSLPAAKAALHRGRTRLREIADEPDDTPQQRLSDADRARLGAYVAHFNARDFDAIRAMIADDIRLDLVSKTQMRGKAEVSRYFGNYAKVSDWRLVPGLVEGHPAILVFDPNDADSKPKYFMLLGWSADKVATIRDFRHAPYVIDGAEYLV